MCSVPTASLLVVALVSGPQEGTFSLGERLVMPSTSPGPQEPQKAEDSWKDVPGARRGLWSQPGMALPSAHPQSTPACPWHAWQPEEGTASPWGREQEQRQPWAGSALGAVGSSWNRPPSSARLRPAVPYQRQHCRVRGTQGHRGSARGSEDMGSPWHCSGPSPAPLLAVAAYLGAWEL